MSVQAGAGGSSDSTDQVADGLDVVTEQGADAGGEHSTATRSKPEVAVGAAFGGGLLLALLLRRIRS